ncbi:hypothetical protein [Streptomyces solaniscabiei]|uniref:hypothetical protein n=1 Tax=Streptomyces solaniscabiei TaxID=2683255 RepID=UPI001CE2E124|nr:hypothetical protein [Streptomyces solaniscabiei]
MTDREGVKDVDDLPGEEVVEPCLLSEENFALFCLSRYLVGHGLVESLRKAERTDVVTSRAPASASASDAGTT